MDNIIKINVSQMERYLKDKLKLTTESIDDINSLEQMNTIFRLIERFEIKDKK